MSLEAITAAALQSAVDAGTLPAPIEDGGGDSGTADTGADISADTGTDNSDASADASAVAADKSSDTSADTGERKWPETFTEDDIKLATELGYNPPVKDNRMPYSKAIKTALKAVRDARTKDAEASKTREAEWKTKGDKLTAFERMQEMANTDPEGFLRSLAAQRPDLYSRFLEARREDAATPKSQQTDIQAARAADPEPQPDVKYEDGSVGYSAEAFKAHNQWLIREGKRQATEEFDKRLKPIEERERAAKTHSELQQSTRAQEAKAMKRWGKLYVENKPAILDALQKDDELAKIERRRLTPFEDVVYDVLMPLKEASLSADRNKVREEVLKELDERKTAAAPKRAAVQAKDDDGDDAPASMEDVVAREVANARKSGRLR